MLRGGFAGAALLLITGCAGAASQRQGEAGVPVLEEMTGKAADRVAGCIVDKLEAQDSSLTQTTFSATQTFDGYSITGTQSVAVRTDTILLIDVVENREPDARPDVHPFPRWQRAINIFQSSQGLPLAPGEASAFEEYQDGGDGRIDNVRRGRNRGRWAADNTFARGTIRGPQCVPPEWDRCK